MNSNNLSPSLSPSRENSVLRFSSAAVAVSAADSAPPAKCSCIAAENLGKKSSVITSPVSSILLNSAVVTPIASEAILNAPGSRSPSCPRSSSADTLPLLIIWVSALITPSVSAAERRRVAAALDTAKNTLRVSSPCRAVPLVAADSLANPLTEASRLIPSFLVVEITNAEFDAKSVKPSEANFSVWNIASNLIAVRTLKIINLRKPSAIATAAAINPTIPRPV